MEENKDEWGDVTIPEKVEYEIEEDTHLLQNKQSLKLK